MSTSMAIGLPAGWTQDGNTINVAAGTYTQAIEIPNATIGQAGGAGTINFAAGCIFHGQVKFTGGRWTCTGSAPVFGKDDYTGTLTPLTVEDGAFVDFQSGLKAYVGAATAGVVARRGGTIHLRGTVDINNNPAPDGLSGRPAAGDGNYTSLAAWDFGVVQFKGTASANTLTIGNGRIDVQRQGVVELGPAPGTGMTCTISGYSSGSGHQCIAINDAGRVNLRGAEFITLNCHHASNGGIGLEFIGWLFGEGANVTINNNSGSTIATAIYLQKFCFAGLGGITFSGSNAFTQSVRAISGSYYAASSHGGAQAGINQDESGPANGGGTIRVANETIPQAPTKLTAAQRDSRANNQGDMAWITNATAGQELQICTAAGTPGTWKYIATTTLS